MDLPAVFYGPYRDVERRTSKLVTQVRKRADWMALVEAEGFLDVVSTAGLIVLAGPSALLGGEPRFQQWLLWQQLFFGNLDISAELADDVFQRSLIQPWNVLANLGIPGESLRAPLPPGGLATLIEPTEQHLH